MGLPVLGFDIVGDIVDRTAQKVQVIHEQRCGECQCEADRAAVERVVCLCRLDIDRSLYRGLLQGGVQVFLHQYSEIQESVGHRVRALCRDDVPAGLQCGCCLIRNPDDLVLVAYGTGIVHFDSVYIEYRIVIVAEFEVEGPSSDVLFQVELPSYKDIEFRPVCPCRRLVDRGAECTDAGSPSGIIIVRRLPASGRPGGDISAFPASLL